ncbi:MAG: CoA transferase [Chloroflexi bacterium]|nr:CoA transferase [Chloroflexota bacterium]
MAGPLQGVRVLDMAGESGLFAGRMLAELGADVVRLEPPGGDAVRRRPPFLESPETPSEASGDAVSLYHLHFNAGKRGITLDRERPEGEALFQRLLRAYDVLLVSGTPAEIEAQRLDFASVSATHASLIWVGITPFGPEGPMRNWRADDLVGVAMSGLMYLNGLPEDPPLAPGAEQGYHMASLVAVTGALIALTARNRDPEGRGRRVDVSMQEAAAMSTLQTANANHFAWHGRVPRRNGLAATGIRNLFPCADGKWISFTIPVGTGPLWGHFVEWLDEQRVPHELSGEQWFDAAFRLPYAEAVGEAIGRLVATMPRDTVFHEGQRRRLLTMPVNDVADLLRDEQLRSRGFFVALDHPALGQSFEVPGAPYRFSATPAGIGRCAPAPGEHNAEVFAALDGLGADELSALTRAGIL